MSRFLALLAAGLLFFFATGCAPAQIDVEKLIREGMKVDQDVDATAIHLTKQPDGSYTGTATAENGDTYDVIVEPPKGNRVRWRATATQATVERLVNERIEAVYTVKVKTLTLQKQNESNYTGFAELEDGSRMKISAKMKGNKLTVETKMIQ